MIAATLKTWEDEMSFASASVHHLIRAGMAAGLTEEASTLAALIGVIAYIRAAQLPEEKLMRAVKAATPVRFQSEQIVARPPR